MNGYTGISSSSSNNSQSLTVFKPAQGMAIQVSFERLDVRNDGATLTFNIDGEQRDVTTSTLIATPTPITDRMRRAGKIL